MNERNRRQQQRCPSWMAVYVFGALLGFIGCGRDVTTEQPSRNNTEDTAVGSLPIGGEIGPEREPSIQDSPPTNMERVSTSDDQAVAETDIGRCQRDAECDGADWCNQQGKCEPPVERWIGTWNDDGLTRVGAARFDLVPDGFEAWTDRASDECPDNRPGLYDGPLTADGPRRACDDSFEDSNGDGRFKALWLGGAGMDRPAKAVDHKNPPEGRVLIVTRNQTVHVLVTLDIHAIGPDTLDRLHELVRVRTGLPEAHLSVHVTGSRSAPDAVGLSGPSWRLMDGGWAISQFRSLALDTSLLATLPIQSGVSTGWLATVARRMATAIKRAEESQVTVELRFTQIDLPLQSKTPGVHFAVPDFNGDGIENDGSDVRQWRREPRAFVRDDHLAGPLDKTLRVLSLDDTESGRPVVLILGWGAAPAMVSPSSHLLSADYPGLVRKKVEAKYPESTVIWLTTAAADTLVADERIFVPQSDENGTLLNAEGQAVNDPTEAIRAPDSLEALTTFLAEMVPRALQGQPKRVAHFKVDQRLMWLPIDNPRFGLAAWLGVLPAYKRWLLGRSDSDRWASADLAPGCGGLGCVKSRIDRLEFAERSNLVLVPGALDHRLVAGHDAVRIDYGSGRNLRDVDGDGVDDEYDELLMARGRLGDVEHNFVIDAAVNPQIFGGYAALATTSDWVIGRTNGGVGTIRAPSQFVNIFEGQLETPAQLKRMAPAKNSGRLCRWGYPCDDELTIDELYVRAKEAQPELLADLLTSRELWCEGEVPFLANETAWRIENAAGELKAQGEQLTIGTNRIVHSPEVNFVALGIQPGDRLILPEWDSRWWQIGGVIPIEMKWHLNATDAMDAMTPKAGDLIYRAVCAILERDDCGTIESRTHDPNEALPAIP